MRLPTSEVRLLARALRSNRRRLGQPFKLTFATTYACQSGCQLCSIWKKVPENELELWEIQRFLQSAPDFSWIDLTGGEPFLRDDIEDIAAAVIETCPSLALLHLPTNGLDPQRVEEGVRAMLGMEPRRLIMTVSIDGPPDLNVALRGHPEAWTAALETFGRLRALRSRRFDVFIGVTLSEQNAHEAEAILGEARKTIPDLKSEELHWNFAQESSHYYSNALDVEDGDHPERYSQLRLLSGDRERPSDGLQGMAGWLRPVQMLDRRYRDHLANFVRTGTSPVPCRALWSTAFIDPHGVLYPCITWDRPLGSLREVDYDLGRLWQARETLEAVELISQGQCPQCWTPCEAVPALLGSVPALLRPPRLATG